MVLGHSAQSGLLESKLLFDDTIWVLNLGPDVSQCKRRFGLGLIREKLADTQSATITLNVLVMNVEKLLELLFVLLWHCYAFSLSMKADYLFAKGR